MTFIEDDVRYFPSTKPFAVVEMTKEWFWHFYECMPPIQDARMSTRMDMCFMVSEPCDWMERNGGGVETYRMCIKNGERYFSVEMPIDFTSEEMLKVLDDIDAA